MVLLGVPQKKSPVTTPGIDPGTVRLVAQLLKFVHVVVFIIKKFVTMHGHMNVKFACFLLLLTVEADYILITNFCALIIIYS